jgi:serine protease Do
VVEGADKVEVTLTDQRRFTAKIAGIDPPSDLAVLRIDASGLPTIPFGDRRRAALWWRRLPLTAMLRKPDYDTEM